jgi:hypothetical protein
MMPIVQRNASDFEGAPSRERGNGEQFEAIGLASRQRKHCAVVSPFDNPVPPTRH